jgi:hypothetical protein
MEPLKKGGFFAFIILLAAQVSLQAQISFGKAEKINEDWKFYLGDKPDEKTQWRTLSLPHDWSVEGVLNPLLASCTGFLPGGIGWYKKTLNIPADKMGGKVYLYFEGVYNRSKVFVNGNLVGSRPNGYISFVFDITPEVRFGADNVIDVHVDHSQSADSRWYTGSGIYRNVWVVYANPVHIAQWGVYVYPKNNRTLSVETKIVNESNKNQNLTIRSELISPDGKTLAKSDKKLSVFAAQNNKSTVDLHIKNPQLWSLETPNLYTLKTTVLQGKTVVDETATLTGFRTFTFDADKGFFLNGENLKVKGICLHHDAGVLGSAVPREVLERRLKTLKKIGVNAIRTSHNPQAPDLYECCDELGLLVLNEAYDEWEFPKNKWIEGWNVGAPGHQGVSDIFADWGEQDLADMVRRDRNHVSIFAWSIGNEVDYPNDPYSHPILDGDDTGFTQKRFGGYKRDAPNANHLGGIAKRLVATVKKYDTSRPVTAGLAGVAMSNETEYPGALDIAGYNYTENRYLSDHKKYPNRVIFGSENRHDLAVWKSVTDNEHIFGQFLWTGIDYLGESRAWPSRGFSSGLIDFAGFIKPCGYFRKALWSNEPEIYLGSYPNWSGNGRRQQLSIDAWSVWNYEDGQQIRVVCYTNAAKAQLFLNNEPVGDLKNYDDNTGIIYWDIPYKAGSLSVKGYDKDGKITCEYTVKTSKQPAVIRMNAYESTISKNRGVAQIEVQLMDENGTLAVLADDELFCRVEGVGKLLGLEAGNNSDMGNYRDNVQRIYRGRMIAYVEATGAGEIKVSFSGNWLKTASINITAK